MEVKEQIKKSLIWSIASTAALPLVQTLRTIILARFLAPHDFGLMSMAMATIVFLEILQQGGLGQAVIQHRGRTEDAASVSFWTQLFISTLIFFLLWILSPCISDLACNPGLNSVLRVMSFALLAAPFSNIAVSLMIRELNFRGIFRRQIAPVFLSSLISIVLACLDYGVWALVIGHLVGSYTQASIFVSYWRPRFFISFTLMKELFAFGGHVVLQGILFWTNGVLFKFLIGTFQGTTTLGYLNIAENFVMKTSLSLNVSLSAVMFPVFSRLERNGGDTKKYYLISLNRLTLIGIPLSAVIYFICPSLVYLLLGEKWLPAITPVRILLLVSAITNIVGLNAEMYKAMGLPGIITRLILFRTVVFVPIFFYTSQQSLLSFLYSYLIAAVSTHLLNIGVCMKVAGISFRELWISLRPSLLVAACLMGMGMVQTLAIPPEVLRHPMGLSVQAALALIFFITFVRVFDRRSYSAAVDFIRSLGARRKESDGGSFQRPSE